MFSGLKTKKNFLRNPALGTIVFEMPNEKRMSCPVKELIQPSPGKLFMPVNEEDELVKSILSITNNEQTITLVLKDETYMKG